MSLPKSSVDLPPDVVWECAERYRQHRLRICVHHVASVDARITEGFSVTVNKRLGIEARLTCGAVPTLSIGKKMAERGLRVHYDRVVREIKQKERAH